VRGGGGGIQRVKTDPIRREGVARKFQIGFVSAAGKERDEEWRGDLSC